MNCSLTGNASEISKKIFTVIESCSFQIGENQNKILSEYVPYIKYSMFTLQEKSLYMTFFLIFFSVALRPNAGHGLLIHEVF